MIDTPTQTAARTSLGALLRAARDRLPPQRTSRRRVPGWRREEVADAANISVAWYTWLEQGRPVRVSDAALDRIASALRLGAVEREHLFELAHVGSAPDEVRVVTSTVSPMLRDVVDALAHPAYVVNALWTVLHANARATQLFGDFDACPGITDNVLVRLFLDTHWRTLFAEWDAVASTAAAQFRAATAPLTGDERREAIIERLVRESSAFAECWGRELAVSAIWRKTLVHGNSGRLSLMYSSFAPDGEPRDVRVIVYVPDSAS